MAWIAIAPSSTGVAGKSGCPSSDGGAAAAASATAAVTAAVTAVVAAVPLAISMAAAVAAVESPFVRPLPFKVECRRLFLAAAAEGAAVAVTAAEISSEDEA